METPRRRECSSSRVKVDTCEGKRDLRPFSPLQVLDYFGGGVRGRLLGQESEPDHPGYAVVQGRQGMGLHLNFRRQVEDRGAAFPVEKLPNPIILSEPLLEVEGRRGSHVGQVQRLF